MSCGKRTWLLLNKVAETGVLFHLMPRSRKDRSTRCCGESLNRVGGPPLSSWFRLRNFCGNVAGSRQFGNPGKGSGAVREGNREGQFLHFGSAAGGRSREPSGPSGFFSLWRSTGNYCFGSTVGGTTVSRVGVTDLVQRAE